MNNRNGGTTPPPPGLKRRMPGEHSQHYGPAASGPMGQRPFDPRFPSQGPPRQGQNGPPVGGRFGGRAQLGGRGRGPPPPPPPPQGMRGRGPPHHQQQQQQQQQQHRPNLPGRGMMPGRGPMPGRNHSMGRGPGAMLHERGPMSGLHGMMAPPQRGPPPPPPPPPPRGMGGAGASPHPLQQRMGMNGMPPPPPPPPGRGGGPIMHMHQGVPNMMMQHSSGAMHSAAHPSTQGRMPMPPPPTHHHGMPYAQNGPPQGTIHRPTSQLQGQAHYSNATPPVTGQGSYPRSGVQQHHMQPSPAAQMLQSSSSTRGGRDVPVGTTDTKVNITSSAPTTYTKDQIDQAWTEHTAPNSMKYYYNSITQESTYKIPQCLEQATKANDDKAKSTERTWVEYADPSSGKKYYSDGVTTTWEKPDGFEMSSDAKRKVEDDDDDIPKKKKKVAVKRVTEFSNKEEAVAAFKGLLLAKGVQPTTKWNDVVKMCSPDVRWEACSILTLGERKQALAEYQTKRANELRTLERQERMRAKEAFLDLLTEVLPTVSAFSATSSRFSDVRDSLSKNDRFYAVEDEETREALFLDFCEEVRKRDDRKKRSKKREEKDAFFAFLKEHEESGELTFASTWNSFYTSLEGPQQSDPRFVVSAAMTDSDRQLYFADYVLELQAAEDEKRRRIRDARRRAEKAQREAYREALRKMASEGVILPSTRWRDIEDQIAKDPTFGLVQAQDREAPRELFEDYVDEWQDVYRSDRSVLNRLISASPRKGITFEEFGKLLLDEAAYSPELYSDIRRMLNREDPISSALLYYNELLSKTREDVDEGLKRAKPMVRRGSLVHSSSEDEGEILEDGEVNDDEASISLKENVP